MNDTFIINISNDKSVEIVISNGRAEITVTDSEHVLKGSAKLKEVKNGTL